MSNIMRAAVSAMIIGAIAELEGTSAAREKARRLNERDLRLLDEAKADAEYRKRITEWEAEQHAKHEAMAAPIRAERIRRKRENYAKRKAAGEVGK